MLSGQCRHPALTSALLVLLGAHLAPVRQGFQAAGAGPTFEVVSVKLNTSGDLRASMAVQPGGRFNASNVSARTLVSYAYQLQESQVLGGPSWLDSDHFDIIARAAENQLLSPPVPGGPPPTIRLMVRALLADRFSLVAHTETRELPVFHLVAARADRSLGPRIRPSTADCSAPQPAAVADSPAACGTRLALGTLSARGRTLAEIGGILSQFVQRPISDQTGIPGAFEFDLTWTPELPPNIPVDQVPAVDPDRPELFTAIQEQLGLRLQATRGPVPALVVDRAERPSPD